MVHSYNQFHAAGHGTFFSGKLTFGQIPSNSFLWVYDCGSKREGRMNGLVMDLHKHAGVGEIDMLCISHFDGDHVNGLVELLKLFKVKRLFLPYLPFNKRLKIVCELDSDVAGSTDAMLFTLDPAGFLASRDLIGRVGSIVLVRGGEGGDENFSRDIDDLPIGPNFHDDEMPRGNVNVAEPTMSGYEALLGGGRRVGVTSVSHANPITVHNKLWEFSFYNKELPKEVAPVSGADLAAVQDLVKTVLNKWNLNTGLAQHVEGWRKDLRQCYEKHFGKSSKGRNDISMCLLSRPLLKGDVEQCKLFDTPFAGLGCAHTLVPISDGGKSALLLTGDISIDKNVLGNMRKHFNSVRWESIHVMQIPHHGSRHSWKIGCGLLCEHEYSVFCVPDIDSSGSHPHQSVLDDLKDRNPLYANYSTAVVFCFHTT